MIYIERQRRLMVTRTGIWKNRIFACACSYPDSQLLTIPLMLSPFRIRYAFFFNDELAIEIMCSLCLTYHYVPLPHYGKHEYMPICIECAKKQERERMLAFATSRGLHRVSNSDAPVFFNDVIAE